MSSVQRGIAAWLVARPWRAAVGSAALGALSPQIFSPFAVVAGAIPVLVDLRQGFGISLGVAAIGAAVAFFVLNSLDMPLLGALASVAVLFFAPTLLAEMLRRTGSLNLCFQVSVLVLALCVILVHTVMQDPVGFWVEPITTIIDSLVRAGVQMRQDSETVVAALSRVMWGLLASVTLISVLSSLFLGRWWQSQLEAPGSFGPEYQQLRVGLVLGVAAIALITASLWIESALLHGLVWVMATALFLQGLAAAHRSKARGRLSRGWLIALYVACMLPVSSLITVPLVVAWGFADNWVRTRPQSA